MPAPGVSFLLRQLPTLVALPIAALSIHVILDRLYRVNLNIPIWVTPLASYPIAAVLYTVYKRLYLILECARLGVVLPPRVKSWIPGGFDILPRLVEDTEDYAGSYFAELYEQYGGIFNLHFASKDHIVISDPEHLKSLLATDFSSYGKGETFQSMARSVLGTGVFNSDGDLWKFHRSMTRPFFNKERITDFTLFQQYGDKLIQMMKDRLSQGYAIDFEDAMSQFTIDVSSEFLFGHCVNSLSDGLAYSPQVQIPQSANRKQGTFAPAFAAIQNAIVYRSKFADLWPLAEMLKDRTEDDMRTVEGVILPIIRKAIERKKQNKAEGDQETLLSRLIEVTDDPQIIKDEVLNIMVAGRDTTAAATTFLMYALSQHPEVLSRLRAEVLEKVGQDRCPTLDDFREMKYLRAVINETLRLFPPVTLDLRSANKATTLVNKSSYGGGKPYYVPKNANVLYSIITTHRRKDLWGPDALSFDPDRFLDARLGKYLTPNPFIFIPFNAGPRICPGQQMAYNEISFMVVRLLQTFDGVDLARESQPPSSLPPAFWKHKGGRKPVEKVWIRHHLTMYPVGGMWLRFKVAKTETLQ